MVSPSNWLKYYFLYSSQIIWINLNVVERKYRRKWIQFYSWCIFFLFKQSLMSFIFVAAMVESSKGLSTQELTIFYFCLPIIHTILDVVLERYVQKIWYEIWCTVFKLLFKLLTLEFRSPCLTLYWWIWAL